MASAITMLIAMSSVRAEAHLNSTGLGPIYDGALHVLQSPEDFVSVIALALLAGLRGARHGRSVLLALPSAWLLGGLAGLAAGSGGGAAATTVASFVVLGVLIAVDAHVSVTTLTVLAAALGLVHGYLNGAGIGPFSAGAQALAGLAAVVFVLVALVAAFVVRLRREPGRIAVRVFGSWIAASGLLMLGWALHRNG
jgi:urease accessory protein